MALLERRELLEGERVDLAQQRQRLLRGAVTALLLGADVRAGLGIRSAVLLVTGRPRRGRHVHVRPVVGDKRLRLHPELGHRALLQRLDAQPLLGPRDLTHVFASYAMEIGIRSGNIPRGAAVSLFMFPILAVCAFFVLRGVTRRNREQM